MDLECPYCEAACEVCHDDGFGYAEDKLHQMKCPECEKVFTFTTHISYSYWPEKADCLNGSPHEFSEWRGLWDDMEERQCSSCGKVEQRGEVIE